MDRIFEFNSKRNVLHTLKAELTTLISVPKAEKFYSLILDSLDKCNVTAVASVKKQRLRKLKEKKRKENLPLVWVEFKNVLDKGPQERLPEASGTKVTAVTSANTSEYESLASEALSKELIKIPYPMVTEMIVRMLSSWSLEQIKPVVLNRWNKIGNVPAEESVEACKCSQFEKDD